MSPPDPLSPTLDSPAGDEQARDEHALPRQPVAPHAVAQHAVAQQAVAQHAAAQPAFAQHAVASPVLPTAALYSAGGPVSAVAPTHPSLLPPPPSLPPSVSADSFVPHTVVTTHQRVLDGKYALERRLGEGGMGTVYIARHLGLRHLVALKLMHGPALADLVALQRFGREARAMASLDHPNIVRVLDFGADAGAPYIAMEYLRGSSLAELLDGTQQPLPLIRVRDILLPVLDGLAAVHAHGVVHRDLKPDNIFLAETPNGEVIKLVDFGLARMDDGDGSPALTKTSAVSGTPDYMSPEQCRSLKVGPETDIYAIGCILTCLLQLSPPFSGGSVVEVLTKQMFTTPPKLERPVAAEPVPTALETLRLDLLAKTADQRPATALEVKRRLLEAFDEGSLDRRSTSRRVEQEDAAGTRRSVSTAPAALPPAAPVEGTCLLVRGPNAPPRLDLITPLATQGIALVEGVSRGYGAVLFDAGDDHAAALAFLASRPKDGPPAIVAVKGLDVPRINALIAAGAADAIGSPVDVALVAKKIGRVLRRRR